MQESYDYIYLSPHLDDAVLSCGAQIFQHIKDGCSVLIVTVMAGDPQDYPLSSYAQALHDRWKIESDDVSSRRDEDKAACMLLGAGYRHWTIADCIYRRNPDSGQVLYTSDDDLFGEINPVESYLIRTIGDHISALPRHHQMLVPLSVGNHVDHQLVRKAAEEVEQKANHIYYEEFPYAAEVRDQELALFLDERWTIETTSVSKDALQVKKEAISCYQSQIDTFFSDKDDIGRQVEEYLARAGGERLFRRSM